MAELPVIKIQNDYEDPPNVESKVPGSQEIREVDENTLRNQEESEIEVGGAQFSLSPILTVTQKETTLTKDGVKSQKLTVTEDIAIERRENGGLRYSSSSQHERELDSRSVRTKLRREIENRNMERDKSEEKKSKIPITRLRQAVEQVKKERREQKERERQQKQPRRSSLPKLKESKIPTKRHTSLKVDPKTEDEFDKIYEEIVDETLKNIDDIKLEVKIEDTEVLESKFEEIIHAYDEEVDERPTVSRISKIPALRRRGDDGASKIGALVERVKAKNPTADSELKDGGFRVTASNITIKRFSRGTSREVSRDNEVSVVKESVDSEVIDKTPKTVPVKPARTYRRKNSEKDNFKIETVEKVEEGKETQNVGEEIRTKATAPVKPERAKRAVSREVKKDDKGTVVIEKFEDDNTKTEIVTKSEGDGTTVKTTTIEREVHSSIPIRTERLIRSYSHSVNKEKPATEKFGQHFSSKTEEQKVINESTADKIELTANKKETTAKDKTAIPVKTERFTRGISIEMGNIRPKDDSSILKEFRENGSHNIVTITKGSVTKDTNSEVMTTEERKERIGNTIKETIVKETIIEETSSKTDESVSKEIKEENGLKTETLKTEYIIKEGIKVGIPVFTKTENLTESTIEDIESTTDEVKSFTRSASENITRTEFKDKTSEKTATFTKDTNINNKETVTNKLTSSVSVQEGASSYKSDVTENVSSSVTIKKVTEYQTTEQKTNVEMNTYMLRNPFDFSLKRDSYNFKNENVQKGETKEIQENSKTDTVLEQKKLQYSRGINETIESKKYDVFVEQKDQDLKEINKNNQSTITNNIKDKNKMTHSEEINKTEDTTITDTIAEKKEIEHSKVQAEDKDSDNEVTVLKGNVSRLKNKISSLASTKSMKQEDIDLPKSTSVSSKIAVFERLESKESTTKDEKHSAINTPEIETNIKKFEDKPKIVEELLKYESYDEKDKIKIGFNYDELIYTSEAKIVDEFWKSAEGPVNNISTHNPVITNKAVLTETKDESEPNTPDVTSINSATNISVIVGIPRENKTETSNLEAKENKIADNQFEVAKTLPIIVKVDKSKTSSPVIEPAVKGDNKTSIKPDLYELPKILPDRDYENEVGKTKPGKINLNNWKTQVAVNKILVDKKDVIKNESLDEIAKTLPDIGFSKNLDQVSKELPETIDLNEKKPEVAKTLPAIINFNINEAINVPTIVPGNLHKTNENIKIIEDKDSLSDINNTSNSLTTEKDEVKPQEIKIPDPVSEKGVIPVKSQLELPKELPEKASYKSQYMDTNNKNSKPVPGKINLNLWKNQVETNKTLLTKKSIINKELEFSKIVKQVEINRPRKVSKTNESIASEIAKPLPTIVSVVSTDLETVRALPSQIDVTLDSKEQPVRTLPAFINFKTNADQIETANDSASFLDVTTDGNLNKDVSKADNVNLTIGEAKIFPARIELQGSGIQVEEARTLPTYIDIKETVLQESTTVNDVKTINVSKTESDFESNKIEEAKSLPGKLDLRAWETQVEVNKTLLSTIRKDNAKVEIIKHVDTDSSETENDEYNFEDDDDFVPANNDFDIVTPKNKIGLGIVVENVTLDESQDDNDLNNNSNPISNESDPKELLSDPELVIDEPDVKEKKASIMNRIRNKLYFINYRNIIRNTANKKLAAEENDRNNEEKEHSIHNSYSFDSKAKEINTSNTEYKETNEFIEETYQKIVKEYTSKKIITESNINVNETENYSNLTESNDSKTEFVKSNEFGLKTEEEFESREEIKRAKSVAELDLGDAVNGKVLKILGRIKSVDFDSRRNVKVEKINLKEMPKKLSVLEKIRLFEALSQQTTFKKQIFLPQAVCPSRTRIRVKETGNIEILQGRTEAKTTGTLKPVTQEEKMVISEEVYEKKIEDLKGAKDRYGSIDKMPALAISESQSIPMIALGTALMDPRLIPHLIKAAIDLGYRAFDTAYIYGNEKEIGAAINEKIQDGTVKREELFIMSKLSSTFHRTDLVQGACKSSLQNLGLDYFDLYMIHNPMSFKEGPDPIPKIASVVQYSEHDYLDAWFGMEELVSSGLVRSIGVSNFNTMQLQRILDKGRFKPVVNQVECHPYLSQERMHAFCKERNITLSCFGVLGSKGTPAEFKNSTTAAIDDPFVKVMASGLNVTPAQLLIRYQIEYGRNVVVKASSAEHLWDNLQALKFTLDSAQMTGLHALNKNRRTFTFQGMGDTHKNYPFN
ncbi:uncharacterized protein LOC113492320 isoform X2 [Trichoplusia ni]|nr:uncharacterized protein LOC113492320 isoform X2 [Trichoplusia ni]